MGETSLLCKTTETKPLENEKGSSFSSNGSVFNRNIDFHPARMPMPSSVFGNGNGSGNSDFYVETLNPNSDCSQMNSSNGDTLLYSSGKGAEGGDLDPEFSLGIVCRKIGAGLENLGNTCFLNSVLQCLTYTEPFAAYLQSGKHQISCHIVGFCAMCAIQNHVKRALQLTGSILAPTDLVMNLRCISQNFCYPRQEDAHEYMVNLLQSMHKCCLPLGLSSESPSAYQNSLVHKIFGGRLRSQVKCMQCSHCSNKYDPFLDLSLEIFRVDSLWKALAQFTAVEQLDGGEKQYHCPQCNQKVRAVKQLTVHEAPFVLTIHLKRFSSFMPGQKIHKPIDFPPTLDLKSFVSGSSTWQEGDLKYTLYGVLVHAGSNTLSGHYYCFVRTSSGIWYYLDDDEVVQVSKKTVFGQKAYMLFYVRSRKKPTPKIPVDVVHKEDSHVNSIENKEKCATILGPEDMVPKGLMTENFSSGICSSVVTQTVAEGSGLMGKPLLNETSVLETNDLLPSEGLAITVDPRSETYLKEGSVLVKESQLETSLQVNPIKTKEHSISILALEETVHEVVMTENNNAVCSSFVPRTDEEGSGLMSEPLLNEASILTTNNFLPSEGSAVTVGPQLESSSKEGSNLVKESRLETSSQVNPIESKEHSVSLLLEERVHKGQATENFDSSACSFVVTQTDAEGSGLMSEPLLNEASVFKTKNLLPSEGSALAEDPMLETSVKEGSVLLKEPLLETPLQVNSIESKEHSVSILLEETVLKEMMTEEFCSSDCSSVATLTDTVGSGLMSEPLLHKASRFGSKDFLPSEALGLPEDTPLETSLKEVSVPSKEPKLETSLMEMANGVSVQHSTSDYLVEDSSPELASSVFKGSEPSSPPTDATGCAETNCIIKHEGAVEDFIDPSATLLDCDGPQNSEPKKASPEKVPHDIVPTNEHEGTVKDFADPVTTPLDWNCPQQSEPKKIFPEMVARKVVSINETLPDGALLKNATDLKSAEAGSLWLPIRSCREDAQNHSVLDEGVSIGQHCQNAEENGLRLQERNSVDVLRQSIVDSASGNKKMVDQCDRQNWLKPKKNHMKLKVAGMRLGSRLLLRASKNLRRKKKRKSCKKRNLEFGMSTRDVLEEESVSQGFEPSTSQITRAIEIQQGRSAKRKAHSWRASENVKDCYDESAMRTAVDNFIERIRHNSAVLATNEAPRTGSSSSLVENPGDSTKSDSSNNKRSSTQNSFMSMLTRGLDQPTVACWEHIESLSSQPLELRTTQSTSIGYVLNAWDEEYDRGRRKKVRSSKKSVNGQNPFQEISTRKTPLKKAKKDRSSSGNRPYRI